MFENNETIKDTEIKVQLKPGHFSVKQKARPVPLHLQEDVGKELEKLIKSGHLEKIKDVDEDCFVSPVVITVKNRQIGKNSTRLPKAKRQLCQNETTHAEYGGITKPDFGRDNARPNNTIIYVQNRSGLCLRTNETIQRN